MYNISLNNNIIPHTRKLANIIPIPKLNKDMNIDTSYRPISLLSVIAKHTIPVHHKQHPTHLHATWLQKQAPEHTITVALDMSKAFDTINIHTLTHKLHQTNIPHTIIKYIANYIKGRKAYTTLKNKTSTQRQFKNGVPQGGVLSPSLFNIYTL